MKRGYETFSVRVKEQVLFKAGVDDFGVMDTQRTPTILEELIRGIVRSICFAVLDAFSSGFYLIFCDRAVERRRGTIKRVKGRFISSQLFFIPITE